MSYGNSGARGKSVGSSFVGVRPLQLLRSVRYQRRDGGGSCCDLGTAVSCAPQIGSAFLQGEKGSGNPVSLFAPLCAFLPVGDS